MIDKNNFKDLITYVLVIALFILAAIILKPIAIPIIYGILLAYIFHPVYKWLFSRLKNENLSAFIVCFGLFLIIILILILIIGAIFRQAVDFYLFLQKLDVIAIVKQILPQFISSSEISTTLIDGISKSISDLIVNAIHKFAESISNIPTLLIQFAVAIFTFFFSLRDGEKAVNYFKSMSPLKKETEERFFKKLKEITNSVLVGQIIVGIIQGLVAGIGYFIFGVQNAILLTLVTILLAIIPMIGAWLVWVPVDVYLIATGNTKAGLGLLIYGVLIISWIDNLARMLIVSKKTQINTGIVLIGMLGGLLVFGFLGLIIGPLVLSYILLVADIYRKNTLNESNK